MFQIYRVNKLQDLLSGRVFIAQAAPKGLPGRKKAARGYLGPRPQNRKEPADAFVCNNLIH